METRKYIAIMYDVCLRNTHLASGGVYCVVNIVHMYIITCKWHAMMKVQLGSMEFMACACSVDKATFLD